VATKRSPVFGVTLFSQAAGTLLLVALALILGEPLPPTHYLVWAALGGWAGAIGLVALYQSLATGRMGVAAPLSAVITAIVPVLYSYFIHGRPAVLQQLGFVVALLAIAFIARPESAAVRLRELGLPLVAGVFFGLFFIMINRAGEVSVLWPLAAARVASSLLLVALAMVFRQDWQVQASSLPLIFLAGVLDVGGNAFFVLSGQTGRLDIATIISSLYPGMTVLLAWVLLKERINRLQTLGVLMALGAIVMIAA
jgi:drug/metabolite transporter (DMT)-like permease